MMDPLRSIQPFREIMDWMLEPIELLGKGGSGGVPTAICDQYERFREIWEPHNRILCATLNVDLPITGLLSLEGQ